MNDDDMHDIDQPDRGHRQAAPAVPPTNANDDAARGGELGRDVRETAAAESIQPAGAEPSLLSREAKAGVEGVEGASERAASDPGRSAAPLSGGRIDARGVTEGSHTGTEGATAAGGPVTSTGGPQGDRPGEGPADYRSRGDRAGFLEGAGGRMGGANSGAGEESDDQGGQLRSMADAAAASADVGAPNTGRNREPDERATGEASAQREGTGETDFGELPPTNLGGGEETTGR